MVSLIAGAAIYWLQVYGYYRDVAATDAAAQIRLVSVATGEPEEIVTDNFQGIDADSSPLRFRACFETPTSLATLTETYELAEDPVPLTGPGWFSCYDAETIGEALESGEALAFVSERAIHPGVDRIVAIFPDGRGYAWHQLEPELAE
ncbi:DUF6446 family protein [Frigidibacter sp. ROC022]|uniref:DUF6446 family protein n=1 Tax=Frigidibacter sp. ROC022 TaxID=2971796 RepID=UPI00215AC1AE|nr:DUF6446 family protein [Frigidibacter sp. ROC022]MCR8726365.1 DUF6446 family protein [Frigidibacter sp. ROC022]